MLQKKKFKTILVPLWVINFCISFGFYGLSLWLPTIYAKMESAPEESFCEVISNTTRNGLINFFIL
jgi:hypothetical protein